MLTNNKKILILSNGQPGNKDGGGILLLRQIESYGINHFCCFSAEDIPNYHKPAIIKEIPLRVAPLRIFRGKKLGKIFKRIPLLEEITYFILLIKRKKEIIKFANNHDVELIYAVLRGDTLPLVNHLIKKLNLPFVGFVSDTVEAEFNDKWLIYKLKKRNYYKALHEAKFLGAAGESMVEYFKIKFNKESVILRNSVDAVPKYKIKKEFSSSIVIGFAGSLYARKEYECFIKALSAFKIKHKNLKIKLLFISNIKSKPINNIEMEFFNWCSQEQVFKIMTEADIGYLPYKFDQRYRMQMRLAFPNKIITYIATQTPVFFHGPDYSSVNCFFKKYRCGVSCGSMKEDDIVAKLEKFVFDKVFYEECKKACLEAYRQEFTKEKMVKNFRYFINKGLQ